MEQLHLFPEEFKEELLESPMLDWPPSPGEQWKLAVHMPINPRDITPHKSLIEGNFYWVAPVRDCSWVEVKSCRVLELKPNKHGDFLAPGGFESWDKRRFKIIESLEEFNNLQKPGIREL